MFQRIVFSAASAGMIAALFLTAMQFIWVTPLIVQAETYETAFHQQAEDEMGDHIHEAAWQPENGWQRTLSTAIGNSLMAMGFALMLIGFYALNDPPSLLQGLAWGLAGYAAFFLAPSLGLPPELPGSTAADLGLRQSWWLGTALATSIGLGLIFIQPNKLLKMLGILLLILPHWLKAPEAALSESLAPHELQIQFIWATAFSNALFWILLGLASAMIFNRLNTRSND